jgi:hypothetical protein
MTGNVNTMLSDGAMCVMPWNTTCGRPRAPRRSCGALEGLAVSAVKIDLLVNIYTIGFAKYY